MVFAKAVCITVYFSFSQFFIRPAVHILFNKVIIFVESPFNQIGNLSAISDQRSRSYSVCNTFSHLDASYTHLLLLHRTMLVLTFSGKNTIDTGFFAAYTCCTSVHCQIHLPYYMLHLLCPGIAVDLFLIFGGYVLAVILCN